MSTRVWFTPTPVKSRFGSVPVIRRGSCLQSGQGCFYPEATPCSGGLCSTSDCEVSGCFASNQYQTLRTFQSPPRIPYPPCCSPLKNACSHPVQGGGSVGRLTSIHTRTVRSKWMSPNSSPTKDASRRHSGTSKGASVDLMKVDMRIPSVSEAHILDHMKFHCAACMQLACNWRKGIKTAFRQQTGNEGKANNRYSVRASSPNRKVTFSCSSPRIDFLRSPKVTHKSCQNFYTHQKPPVYPYQKPGICSRKSNMSVDGFELAAMKGTSVEPSRPPSTCAHGLRHSCSSPLRKPFRGLQESILRGQPIYNGTPSLCRSPKCLIKNPPRVMRSRDPGAAGIDSELQSFLQTSGNNAGKCFPNETSLITSLMREGLQPRIKRSDSPHQSENAPTHLAMRSENDSDLESWQPARVEDLHFSSSTNQDTPWTSPHRGHCVRGTMEDYCPEDEQCSRFISKYCGSSRAASSGLHFDQSLVDRLERILSSKFGASANEVTSRGEQLNQCHPGELPIYSRQHSHARNTHSESPKQHNQNQSLIKRGLFWDDAAGYKRIMCHNIVADVTPHKQTRKGFTTDCAFEPKMADFDFTSLDSSGRTPHKDVEYFRKNIDSSSPEENVLKYHIDDTWQYEINNFGFHKEPANLDTFGNGKAHSARTNEDGDKAEAFTKISRGISGKKESGHYIGACISSSPKYEGAGDMLTPNRMSYSSLNFDQNKRTVNLAQSSFTGSPALKCVKNSCGKTRKNLDTLEKKKYQQCNETRKIMKASKGFESSPEPETKRECMKEYTSLMNDLSRDRSLKSQGHGCGCAPKSWQLKKSISDLTLTASKNTLEFKELDDFFGSRLVRGSEMQKSSRVSSFSPKWSRSRQTSSHQLANSSPNKLARSSIPSDCKECQCEWENSETTKSRSKSHNSSLAHESKSRRETPVKCSNPKSEPSRERLLRRRERARNLAIKSGRLRDTMSDLSVNLHQMERRLLKVKAVQEGYIHLAKKAVDDLSTRKKKKLAPRSSMSEKEGSVLSVETESFCLSKLAHGLRRLGSRTKTGRKRQSSQDSVNIDYFINNNNVNACGEVPAPIFTKSIHQTLNNTSPENEAFKHSLTLRKEFSNQDNTKESNRCGVPKCMIWCAIRAEKRAKNGREYPLSGYETDEESDMDRDVQKRITRKNDSHAVGKQPRDFKVGRCTGKICKEQMNSKNAGKSVTSRGAISNIFKAPRSLMPDMKMRCFIQGQKSEGGSAMNTTFTIPD